MEYLQGKPEGCLIRECANGNEEAYKVAAILYSYIDWLDNVIDGDVKVPVEDSARVSLNLFMMLSFNPFFQEHKEKLTPILVAAYNAWLDSERCKTHADYRVRVCADALKGYFLEVFYFIGFITGGYDKMRELSVKWRGFDFDARPDAPATTIGPIVVAPQVVLGREFVFPQDHNPHPDFPLEWWYCSGFANDEHGVEYGFHVCHFRVNGQAHGHFSLCRTNHMVESYDVQSSRFYWDGADRAEWVMCPDGVGLVEVAFKQGSTVVLQGDNGYSKKSDAEGHASYYYSIPESRVTISTPKYNLKGTAWFDHEWGTSLKPQGCGWVFFWLKLKDGFIHGYLMIKDRVPMTKHSSVSFIRNGVRNPVELVTWGLHFDTVYVDLMDGSMRIWFDESTAQVGTALGNYREQPCKAKIKRGQEEIDAVGYLEIAL